MITQEHLTVAIESIIIHLCLRVVNLWHTGNVVECSALPDHPLPAWRMATLMASLKQGLTKRLAIHMSGMIEVVIYYSVH